jgi:hypothetical protein
MDRGFVRVCTRPKPDIDHRLPGQPTYDPGPITEDLPDDPVARAAAQLIMQLIVEVLARQRPASHFGALVTPSVARCVRVARMRAGNLRLASLHVRQPCAEAVEVAAVCRTADGHRALAARIDSHALGEWRCTAFRFL